jgi:hypothetical protein
MKNQGIVFGTGCFGADFLALSQPRFWACAAPSLPASVFAVRCMAVALVWVLVSMGAAAQALFERQVIDIEDQQFNLPLDMGDVNGDAVPDFVTMTGDPAVGEPRELKVLLSNGAASYHAAPDAYTVPDDLELLMLAHLNNDGWLDVFGLDRQMFAQSARKMYVFLNDGSGRFRSPISREADGYGPAIADFNNDGKQDLALIPTTRGVAVHIFLGNGDGTFSSDPIAGTEAASGDRLVAADFDGDGNQDLLADSQVSFEGGSLWHHSMLWGDGTGHFSTVQHPKYYFLGGISAVTDLNKDGRADILGRYFIEQDYPTPDIPATFILYGSADRQLREQTFQNNAVLFYSKYPAGDFDADGDRDLSASGYRLLDRQANGEYSKPTFFSSGDGRHAPFVADFNGDGKTDLLVPIIDTSVFPGNFKRVELYLNLGSGMGCARPRGVDVVVCDPQDGSSVESPVQLRAEAKLSSAVYRFEVWANGVKIHTERDKFSIDTNVKMAPGDYMVRFVARSLTGERVEETLKMTVMATSTNCQPPATNGIVICDPAPFAQVTSPFPVRAFAKTGDTYRFELWASGSGKLATVRNSGTMDVMVSLPPGGHTLHFIARRVDGVRYTADRFVTVRTQ